MTFDQWWHDSGIMKLDANGNVRGVYVVAREAWFAAMREAVVEWEKPYGLTDGRRFEVRLREMANRPDSA